MRRALDVHKPRDPYWWCRTQIVAGAGFWPGGFDSLMLVSCTLVMSHVLRTCALTIQPFPVVRGIIITCQVSSCRSGNTFPTCEIPLRLAVIPHRKIARTGQKEVVHAGWWHVDALIDPRETESRVLLLAASARRSYGLPVPSRQEYDASYASPAKSTTVQSPDDMPAHPGKKTGSAPVGEGVAMPERRAPAMGRVRKVWPLPSQVNDLDQPIVL